MAANHEDLVRILVARGFDTSNVSASLNGLEVKGLVTITRTPGGRVEGVDLTTGRRNRMLLALVWASAALPRPGCR